MSKPERITGMQDRSLQRFVDVHPDWPHITAARQHIVDQLHNTLVDALEKEASVEEVEIIGQIVGQVALGEIALGEI